MSDITITPQKMLIRYRYLNAQTQEVGTGELRLNRTQFDTTPLQPRIQWELIQQGIEFAVIGRVEVEVDKNAD